MSRLVRAKAVLDLVATIFIICAAGILIYRLGGLRPTDTTVRPRPQPYAAGDRFPTVEGLDITGASQTLLVWVQSTCRFCTESMEFYRSALSKQPRARIVVMGPEPIETIQEYLRRHSVEPDSVLSVPREKVAQLSGTPTLLLVGSDAVIRAVWRGKLRDASEEQKVIAAISESGS